MTSQPEYEQCGSVAVEVTGNGDNLLGVGGAEDSQVQALFAEWDAYYDLAQQQVETQAKLLDTCTTHKRRARSCHVVKHRAQGYSHSHGGGGHGHHHGIGTSGAGDGTGISHKKQQEVPTAGKLRKSPSMCLTTGGPAGGLGGATTAAGSPSKGASAVVSTQVSTSNSPFKSNTAFTTMYDHGYHTPPTGLTGPAAIGRTSTPMPMMMNQTTTSPTSTQFVRKPVLGGRNSARSTVRAANLSLSPSPIARPAPPTAAAPTPASLQQQRYWDAAPTDSYNQDDWEQYDYNNYNYNGASNLAAAAAHRQSSEESANAYVEARAVQDSPITSPKLNSLYHYSPLSPTQRSEIGFGSGGGGDFLRRANTSRILSKSTDQIGGPGGSLAFHGGGGDTSYGNPAAAAASEFSPSPKGGHHHVYLKRTSLTSRVNNSTKMVTTPSPTAGAADRLLYRGSFRESMTPVNGGSSPNDRSVVYPPTLTPVNSPKSALVQALEKLRSSDWDDVVEGFRLLVRLVRFHTEIIRAHLHEVNMTALKQLSNLRSQVSRAGCQFFIELFNHLGKSMEYDVDKVSERLLDRSSDMNKFIRKDAGSALEAMALNLSASKTIGALEAGVKHKNPIARATTARVLALIVGKTNLDRCMGDLAEKLLPMLVKLLQEGSLEARTHAKSAIGRLMGHPSFQAQLKRLISEEDLRKVTKAIIAIRNELRVK